MSADPAALATEASPWPARRRRAQDLRARHPFAAELLTLYLALLPVQEDAWTAVRESPPPVGELPAWAAARVLPAVVEATVAAGPATLGDAVRERAASGVAFGALAGWLADAELDAVDRYMARACLGPVLESLGSAAGTACAAAPDRPGEVCPVCAGPPQVSVLSSSGESLVSGGRSLLCARCAATWGFSRSTCVVCGEGDRTRLVMYAEHWHGSRAGGGKKGIKPERPVFPHMRIAGCESCGRYLIEADLARDGRAVAEVDELAALPLDLYAADQGLTKVTPNLMGF